MPFPMNKKKPSPFSVDLGPMDPLEDRKPSGKPVPAAVKPAPKPRMHEEAEEPAEEAAEDYGSKLVSDLEAVGEENGLDAEATRRVAAGFFRAMATCMEGKEPVAEYDAGGMSMEGEEE